MIEPEFISTDSISGGTSGQPPNHGSGAVRNYCQTVAEARNLSHSPVVLRSSVPARGCFGSFALFDSAAVPGFFSFRGGAAPKFSHALFHSILLLISSTSTSTPTSTPNLKTIAVVPLFHPYARW